ncbi:exonuclease 3'-5' domain-containing protein 2 isoform X2 [Bradysia coprophila]|uniref:exonuclease 3'-5' domain-containing protein 2 isoform X2 n=1 Tax=Bradysia coprophila TaxID=38358 RepID=UPI00187D8316|nr:exonuclease 3'-5' domain-containing protein 2 isoform X2 [Bradysia coprophila]
MQNKHKLIVSTALFATLGISVLYVLRNGNIVYRLRRMLDYRNPLRNQEIVVANNFGDCQKIVERLKRHCTEYRVLGFDCEWTTVNGSRRPVALLQLATHRGLCGLFRLSSLKTVPSDLRAILEDENIIKVGVVPIDDSKYLAQDYGIRVASTLDLRHLAKSLGYEPSGLAKLAEIHLSLKMNKNWRIRCSDWEARSLTDEQLGYAATDAFAAVEIFKTLNGHSDLRLKFVSKHSLERDIGDCGKYLNLKFSNVIIAPSAKSSKKQVGITMKPVRSFSMRTNVLYTNCFLQAPDGELLASIDRRKAEWYINKSLGTLVTDSPYTVRLNFEPAARARGDVGEFYKLPKLNQCVVCGASESFNRKNIVPREYRKHFPDVMKSHSSHDIVLLCPQCNRLSSSSDMTIRLQLAAECDAPFLLREGCLPRITHSVELKQRRSFANALYLNENRIPDERKQFLKQELLKHYPPGTEITEQLLVDAMETETGEVNAGYSAHGAKVVEFYKNSDGGLIMLENIWREHFVKRD